MTRITELQRELLRRAAGEPITDAAAVDASVSSALIQRRLVILLSAEGAGGRLIITRTGLAALAAADGQKAGRAAVNGGPGKPRPEATTADPRSKKGKSTGRRPAFADPPEPPPGGANVGPPKGKLGALVALLKRGEGASVEEMMTATGWQAHSVRGAMSGGLKKKFGLVIESEKAAAGRVYRIIDAGTGVGAS